MPCFLIVPCLPIPLRLSDSQDLLEDLRALDDLEGQAAEEQAPPQPEYLDEEVGFRLEFLLGVLVCME